MNDNSNNQIRFTLHIYNNMNNNNLNEDIDNLEGYDDEYEDNYEDDDEDNESYEYTPHDNFFTNNRTSFQCHICRDIVNIFDYDEHIASHMTEISQNTVSTLTSILQPLSSVPSIASLFGLSNSSPFLNPPLNTFEGISFSNLFHSSHNFPLSLSQTLSLSYQIFDDSVYNDYEANLRLGDLIGKVEVGVSNIDKVSKIIDKDTLDDGTICSICIEDIKKSDNKCRELICAHKYCDECISKWLSTSKRCPVCNVDLDEKVMKTQIDTHSETISDLNKI